MYIFVEAERFGTEWYSTPRIASPRIFLAKCGVVRRFVHFNGSDFSRRDFDPSFLSRKREREREIFIPPNVSIHDLFHKSDFISTV